ncbi:MAG: EamA/RhaT family transporter, partial [Bacteroidia bacterium]|nr:EamA/RhaT family transporter [Bacteroidia bacterium]
MLYIILTITISVSLLILFKYFDKHNIDSFFAIAINYLAATLTGIIVSGNSIENSSILHTNWLPYTIPLGLLFILVFYGISKTAQLIGISIAALANKMSLAMPVL